MPQSQSKGKRSSKIHTVPSRHHVCIPAGYKAVPMNSNAR